jgi:hypothetical protein
MCIVSRDGQPLCPMCRRELTRDGKCYKCFISVCRCGRPTESAMISVCRPCEVAEYRRLGIPY